MLAGAKDEFGETLDGVWGGCGEKCAECVLDEGQHGEQLWW